MRKPQIVEIHTSYMRGTNHSKYLEITAREKFTFSADDKYNKSSFQTNVQSF